MKNEHKPKLNPEETAKLLRNSVSLGIPDTRFAGKNSVAQSLTSQPVLSLPIQEIEDSGSDTDKMAAKVEMPPHQVMQSPPAAVSVRRKRKEQPENYRDTYFHRVDFSDRQPLYITRTTHEKLMMIVNIIGGRKATISSYVENIVLQHIENNREEINRLFDELYINPVMDKETTDR